MAVSIISSLDNVSILPQERFINSIKASIFSKLSPTLTALVAVCIALLILSAGSMTVVMWPQEQPSVIASGGLFSDMTQQRDMLSEINTGYLIDPTQKPSITLAGLNTSYSYKPTQQTSFTFPIR